MENKYGLPDDHLFTYDKIIALLEECMGKTLGEVDKNHVFDKTKTNPKITGIAGDVVEQSILGYKPDSDQRPDILIDDVPTEVKTTGIRYSKKKGQEGKYEAKEPMSITAVSPKTIVNEEFYGSHFCEKLAHMLLVYYLYDSNVTVEAKDYAKFFLKSYELHEFNDEDTNRLQSDWKIVRDFIREIQKNYSDPESQYPRISSELRDRLMYVDTAPKWPNSPRFRLKRSVVTSIVRNHFDKKLEVLPDKIDNFAEFDKKLHEITKLYKGKTVEELVKYFNIEYEDINKLNKAIAEQIVIKMFGGKSKKINQIDLFHFLSGILVLFGSVLEEDFIEKRIWNQLGGENKGYLNKKQFKKFCKDYVHINHWRELFLLFDLYDKDHNGNVDYNEFAPFLKKYTGGEEYSEIFETFSTDKKKIYFYEAKAFFQQLQGEKFSNKKIATIISEFRHKSTEEGKEKMKNLAEQINEFFGDDEDKDFTSGDPLYSELRLSKKDFKRLLESRICSVFDQEKIDKKPEDYRPLNDFYINHHQ